MEVGFSPGANRTIPLLRSVYRKTCADIETLHDPVSFWLDADGRFRRKTCRTISTPAEIPPCWGVGIEAEVHDLVIRDALGFALYAGTLRDEVLTLNWKRVDMKALTFRVVHTRGGFSPELPFTSQLATILDRRRAASGNLVAGVRAWVFPSPTSASRHLKDPHHLYRRIDEAVGAKFRFRGMRNCFLAVAERELKLPSSLASRLLNRTPTCGFAVGHPTDSTIQRLREPAQRIADRIEELINAAAPQ